MSPAEGGAGFSTTFSVFFDFLRDLKHLKSEIRIPNSKNDGLSPILVFERFWSFCESPPGRILAMGGEAIRENGFLSSSGPPARGLTESEDCLQSRKI